MSENIVSELIRNPNLAKLQGQKRKMSVLFSDIVSFTSFSEEHRPEYVVERLNEYLDSMTQTVIDNGGTLDKFVGDEIVALFGAPIEDSKHANKAVKTALDMKNKLKEMKKKWKNNSEKLFDFGIGINSGEMLVGNIGAEGKKMDYTVIGDNVNLGARVEGLTRYYNVNILITEDTYNRITEFVDNCRFIDIVKVKGKKKPTKIYELRDEPFDEDIRELIINGYEYYCNRNWEKAEDCYKKILDKNKQDPVAKVFLKRIKSFRMKAPDDDWHGIFVLDKK